MTSKFLIHYGVKGMRWKDHKYDKIVNGVRIYDEEHGGTSGTFEVKQKWDPNDAFHETDADKKWNQIMNPNSKPEDTPLKAAKKAYKTSLLKSTYERINRKRERSKKGPLGKIAYDIKDAKNRGARKFVDDSRSRALSESIKAFSDSGKKWCKYLFK